MIKLYYTIYSNNKGVYLMEINEKELVLDEISSFCINKLLFMIKSGPFSIAINKNITKEDEFILNWYAVLCNLMDSKMYISGKKLAFVTNYSKLKKILSQHKLNFKYIKYVEGGEPISISNLVDMVKSVLNIINSEKNTNYTLEELLNV